MSLPLKKISQYEIQDRSARQRSLRTVLNLRRFLHRAMPDRASLHQSLAPQVSSNDPNSYNVGNHDPHFRENPGSWKAI